MLLVPHEPPHTESRNETAHLAFTVLPDSLHEVRRDSYVERSAWPTRHDVNTGADPVR